MIEDNSGAIWIGGGMMSLAAAIIAGFWKFANTALRTAGGRVHSRKDDPQGNYTQQDRDVQQQILIEVRSTARHMVEVADKLGRVADAIHDMADAIRENRLEKKEA